MYGTIDVNENDFMEAKLKNNTIKLVNKKIIMRITII